jgi:undecaprenyl-diphosphatase
MNDDRTLIVATVLWVILLVLAITLSFLAAANDMLPGDRAIIDWFQDQSIPGQGLSDLIRSITGTEVILVTGAVLAVVLWLRGNRRQAGILAVGLAILPVLQLTLKDIVDRPRPDSDLVDIRAGYSSPSFPSGHVMSSVYLYGFLLYLAMTLPLPRIPAILLAAFSIGIIVLSGPVNVWLGVHWPSDVVGAVLWAAVLAVPLLLLNSRLNQRFPQTLR